jgi:hypothetical protein
MAADSSSSESESFTDSTNSVNFADASDGIGAQLSHGTADGSDVSGSGIDLDAERIQPSPNSSGTSKASESDPDLNAKHLQQCVPEATDSSGASSLDLDRMGKEQRINCALKALRTSGIKSNGHPCLSIREASRRFNVPHSTLTDRYNGKLTRKDAHEHEQRLSAAQEEVLVEWVKTVGRRGMPLTTSTLRDFASNICQVPVGTSWAKRFIARHPELKIRWTTGLEKCRAQSLNRTVVNEFFELIRDLIETHNIPPENIYNMDEKGVQLGIGKRIAALVDRDQKNVYHIEDGNRELVTIIETVCADGTSLHPCVIFQGRRMRPEWGRVNPCNARYAHPCLLSLS